MGANEGEVFVNPVAVQIEFSTKKARGGEKDVTYICQTASVNESSSRG